MARKKYWLGSTGPFFYDDEKVRSDGTPHGIQFEDAPVIGGDKAATQSEVATNAGVQRINDMEEDYVSISAQSPLTVTANSGLVNVSVSGYDGTITVPSANTGMVYDLTFIEGVLQTVVERAI
jgi:hypothetical protein